MVFEGIGMELYVILIAVIVVIVVVIFYFPKPRDWEEEEEEELLREIMAKGINPTSLKNVLKKSIAVARLASRTRRGANAQERIGRNLEKTLQDKQRDINARKAQETLLIRTRISQEEQRLAKLVTDLSTLDNQINNATDKLDQEQIKLTVLNKNIQKTETNLESKKALLEEKTKELAKRDKQLKSIKEKIKRRVRAIKT